MSPKVRGRARGYGNQAGDRGVEDSVTLSSMPLQGRGCKGHARVLVASAEQGKVPEEPQVF